MCDVQIQTVAGPQNNKHLFPVNKTELINPVNETRWYVSYHGQK